MIHPMPFGSPDDGTDIPCPECKGEVLPPLEDPRTGPESLPLYVGKEFMSQADRAAFRLAQNRQTDFLKRFMNRFRAAVRAIQAQITPEMILRVARSGDASEITNLDFEAEFQRLTKGTNAEEIDLISLLLGVANISGTAAAEKLLRDLGLRPKGFEARFDVINPFTFPALKAHGADLVREISEGTRAAINQTLIDGFLDGDSPRVIANRLRNVIGLTQGQAGTVSRFRARMIEDGITGKALERNVAAFYRKKIALRAESIGRTEIFHAQAQVSLMPGWSPWMTACSMPGSSENGLPTWPEVLEIH